MAAVSKSRIAATKTAVTKKKALPPPPGKQENPEEEEEQSSEESENTSDSGSDSSSASSSDSSKSSPRLARARWTPAGSYPAHGSSIPPNRVRLPGAVSVNRTDVYSCCTSWYE